MTDSAPSFVVPGMVARLHHDERKVTVGAVLAETETAPTMAMCCCWSPDEELKIINVPAAALTPA